MKLLYKLLSAKVTIIKWGKPVSIRIAFYIYKLCNIQNKSIYFFPTEYVEKFKKSLFSILDSRTAQYFVIGGEKGEKKFIALHHEKVIWQ